MAGSTASEPAPWPAVGAFIGRQAFAEALRGLIVGAIPRGVRRLRWASADPRCWPWEQPELLDALTRWVREPGRRVEWVGLDFEPLRTVAPRLTRWRATWDHRISCHAVADATELGGRECLLLDQVACLEWLDARQGRAHFSDEVAQIQQSNQWFDAVLQRSSVTFPVTTLGI